MMKLDTLRMTDFLLKMQKALENLSEDELQAISNAFTHIFFRNGIVEDYHADNASLTDEVMKELNIFTNNQIYSYLYTLKNIESIDITILVMLFSNPGVIDTTWNNAEVTEEFKNLADNLGLSDIERRLLHEKSN